MIIERCSMALACAIVASACSYQPTDGAGAPRLEATQIPPVEAPSQPAVDPAEQEWRWVATPVETDDGTGTETAWIDRLLLSEAAYLDTVGSSADGSAVAYFRQTTGLASDLYVTRTETGETRLADKGVVAMIPNQPVVISPDGATVLYRKTLDGGAGSWHSMNDLWAWSWDAGEAWLVAEGVYQASYRFTPDSQHVVYAHTWAKDLYIYELATREPTLVSENVFPPAQKAEQSFPVSEDSRYLVYTRGYPADLRLHLLDLETWEEWELADNVVQRTARFVGEGWLAYQTQGDQGRTLYQYQPGTGETLASGQGNGFRSSSDYRHVAYIDAADGVVGELRVWSRDTGVSVSVDSAVRQSLYTFDAAGGQLVYARQLTPSGANAYWGTLHAWSLAAQDRIQLADYVWTDGQTLDVAFSPDSRALTYRSAGCGAAGNLRVVALGTGESSIIGNRVCGATYAASDGASFVFTSEDPSRLMEFSIDSGVTSTLAEAPVASATSPDRAVTVHTLQSDVDVAPSLLVTNWDTGAVRIITSDEPGLGLELVTDTHLVYAVQGPPSGLWLAELPR